MRLFREDQLLIGSHNTGKVKEISDLLSPFNIKIRSVSEFNVIEPEETGVTFAENALLKAQYFSAQTHLPVLADDSGLAVPVLKGEPGVYSARWAEMANGKRDFYHAMNILEEKLDSQKDIDAYFMCVLCLIWPDGYYRLFEGRIDGKLTFPPRGTHGFGYDPIFIPKGYEQTFGEMAPALKHSLSHRSIAFQKMVNSVFQPFIHHD